MKAITLGEFPTPKCQTFRPATGRSPGAASPTGERPEGVGDHDALKGPFSCGSRPDRGGPAFSDGLAVDLRYDCGFR